MRMRLRFALVVAGVLLLPAQAGLAEPPGRPPGPGPLRRPEIPRRILDLGADLQVGMQLLPTATPTPWKITAETHVAFARHLSVHTETRAQATIWAAFHWSSTAPAPAEVEWQCVVQPESYGRGDWAHPTGLVAKGRATSVAKPGEPGGGYFCVDVRPVLDLPPEFRYPHIERIAPRIPRGRPPPADAPVRPSVPRFTLGTPFQRMVAELAAWRRLYFRVVLLDAAGRPLATSSYVTVATDVPSGIPVYAGALGAAPSPTVTPVKAPDVKILSFTPEIYPYDKEGWYLVLSNCPPWLKGKVGQEIHLQPGDDSWIEKAGAAVTSAVEAVGSVWSWIADAWQDLQDRFVEGVCGQNATCRGAVRTGLKVGLAYCGIPSELPSFHGLVAMGKDYLAAYVVEQVPGLDEAQVRAQIERLSDIVNNPPGGAGASFLWPAPSKQDRPARIMVQVTNATSEATDGICLCLRYGSSAEDGTTYRPDIPTFLQTVTPIPPLEPNTSLVFPIFLTLNPETAISHGNDERADYMRRPVEIYTCSGTLVFSLPTNWWGVQAD